MTKKNGRLLKVLVIKNKEKYKKREKCQMKMSLAKACIKGTNNRSLTIPNS